MSRPFSYDFPNFWQQPTMFNQFPELNQAQVYPYSYQPQLMPLQPIQVQYSQMDFNRMMPPTMATNLWNPPWIQMGMSSRPMVQKISSIQNNQNSQTRLLNQPKGYSVYSEVICLDDSEEEVIEVKPSQAPKSNKKSKLGPTIIPKPTVSQQKQAKRLEKSNLQPPPKKILDMDNLERAGLVYDPDLKKENKRSKVRTRVYSPETFKTKKSTKPKMEYVKWVPQKYTLVSVKRQTMPQKFDMSYKRRFITQFKSKKIPNSECNLKQIIKVDKLLLLYKSISQWANDEHVAQILNLHDYDINECEKYIKQNSCLLAYSIEVQRAQVEEDQVQRKKI